MDLHPLSLSSVEIAPSSSSLSSLPTRRTVDDFSPPLRLAKLFDGISRSAYPTLKNFRFLRRLQLKTIVSLIPEPPTSDLAEFCTLFNINLVHISVNKSEALNPALQGQLLQALHICINRDNHPVHIHCLDGRHITSLLMLLLQRLMGYSPLSAICEYWRYLIGTSSQVTQTEIEKYTEELEKFTNEMGLETVIPQNIPKWLWNGNRSSSVKGMKLRFDPPLEVSEGCGSSADLEIMVDRNSDCGAGVANVIAYPTSSCLRGGEVLPTPNSSSSGEDIIVFAGGTASSSNGIIIQGGPVVNNSSGANNNEEISRNVDALSLDGLDVGFVRKKMAQ